MTCYLKGKDGKIKNIEQLDNIENRGIEIRYKTNRIENIEANGYFTMITEDQPTGFKTIKPTSQLEDI